MSLVLPPAMPGQIVDAHHHLWALGQVSYPWLMSAQPRFFGDPSSIRHDYDPSAFCGDWEGVPIAASVHVQVGTAPGAEVAETRLLQAMAEMDGLPSAIIAFADLTAPELSATLDLHAAASSRLRGVRQIISRRAEEDLRSGSPQLLDDRAFRRGLELLAMRSLVFDLQLTPPYLLAAAKLFAEIPELAVNLCHAGSPWDRTAVGLARWQDGLAAFAELPQASIKLSGFAMFEPDWTDESIARIVSPVLAAFGPDRVMWGSNFPVDRIHRGYAETLMAVAHAVPEASRAAVFGETARRGYRLGLS